MRLLLLLLLPGLAWADPASTPVPPADVDVRSGVLTPKASVGTPTPVVVEGGCYLSETKCLETGKELIRLREENAKLRQGPAFSPAQLIAAACFLVGGFVLGMMAHAAATGR